MQNTLQDIVSTAWAWIGFTATTMLYPGHAELLMNLNTTNDLISAALHNAAALGTMVYTGLNIAKVLRHWKRPPRNKN